MATRVFLLSADEKAVHVITQILDEQDIRFEHSSDPTFTLKRLAGQHFDVLIVDCDNAESATQVFNSARASSLNRGAIAVAIVEGKAGVPNAFRLGASLVLTKPVSLDQARNTLRTAVGMTRKEPLEMRAPATSAPVVPVIPPPVATVPAPVPAAPSPIIALPTPAPAVPSVPSVPVVGVSATPPVSAPPVSAPKAVDPPVAPRISAPPIPVAPRTESPALEKAHSAPALVKDQPVLQVTETRIVKTEEIADPAPVQEKPKPFSSEKISESLSSALVEPVPNVPAFAKLEAEIADQKTATATASPLQMFAPLPKEIVDSAADKLDADFEESAAALRAGAVPAFGGLAKQPFAGIDTSHKRGHGALIAGALVAVAAGAFVAAWFYAPGFQKTVIWEVARVREKIHGFSAKPAPAVSVVPATPAPPVAASAPAPSDATSSTLATEPSASPNSVPPIPQGAVAQSPASGAVSSVATSASSPSSAPPAKSAPAPVAATNSTPTPPSGKPSLVNTSATTGSIPAASKPAELFEVPEDYADDQVLHRIHPAYPKVARAKKIQGTVVLQAIVDKQGKVDSLQLVSGDPLLAQAAADAVKQWRYKPYSHNGDPAEFQTRITVDFRLP